MYVICPTALAISFDTPMDGRKEDRQHEYSHKIMFYANTVLAALPPPEGIHDKMTISRLSN